MDPNRTRQLAEQFIDRLLRFEKEGGSTLDDLVQLFADDAEIETPAVDLAAPPRAGVCELRHFWQVYRDVLGRARSRFFRVTASEDAAGLFWTTGAVGPDGRTVEYDGATLLVFDDAGRIARLRAYFDVGDLSHGRSSSVLRRGRSRAAA